MWTPPDNSRPVERTMLDDILDEAEKRAKPGFPNRAQRRAANKRAKKSKKRNRK